MKITTSARDDTHLNIALHGDCSPFHLSDSCHHRAAERQDSKLVVSLYVPLANADNRWEVHSTIIQWEYPLHPDTVILQAATANSALTPRKVYLQLYARIPGNIFMQCDNPPLDWFGFRN